MQFVADAAARHRRTGCGRHRARRRGAYLRRSARRGRAVHRHDLPGHASGSSACSRRRAGPTRRATASWPSTRRSRCWRCRPFRMLVVFGAFACIFEGLEEKGMRSALDDERLVAVHARIRTSARPAVGVRRVHRGHDRARAARVADRVPADDLQLVLEARGRGHRPQHPRRHAADSGRHDPAGAPHRLPHGARQLLGAVDDLVHRGAGDAHVVRLAGVLPVAEPAPVVGHRGRAPFSTRPRCASRSSTSRRRRRPRCASGRATSRCARSRASSATTTTTHPRPTTRSA